MIHHENLKKNGPLKDPYPIKRAAQHSNLWPIALMRNLTPGDMRNNLKIITSGVVHNRPTREQLVELVEMITGKYFLDTMEKEMKIIWIRKTQE